MSNNHQPNVETPEEKVNFAFSEGCVFDYMERFGLFKILISNANENDNLAE